MSGKTDRESAGVGGVAAEGIPFVGARIAGEPLRGEPLSYLGEGAHLRVRKKELLIEYARRGPLARLGLAWPEPRTLRIAHDAVEGVLLDEGAARVVVQVVGPTGRTSLVGMQFAEPTAVERVHRYAERHFPRTTHLGPAGRRRASRLSTAYLVVFALLGVVALAVALASR